MNCHHKTLALRCDPFWQCRLLLRQLSVCGYKGHLMESIKLNIPCSQSGNILEKICRIYVKKKSELCSFI